MLIDYIFWGVNMSEVPMEKDGCSFDIERSLQSPGYEGLFRSCSGLKALLLWQMADVLCFQVTHVVLVLIRSSLH